MSEASDSGSTAGRLQLQGDLGIGAAVDAHRTLAGAVARGDVDLDLSQVTHVDGSGLQVLLHAARAAMHAGHRLRIVAASPAVNAALALTRLADAFEPQEASR